MALPDHQELSFLREILQKNHIDASIVTKSELMRDPADEASDSIFYIRRLLRLELPHLREKTIYELTDSLTCSYRVLLLPDFEAPTLLVIGPFRTETLSEQERLELCERNAISPQRQRLFSEYYDSIPLIPSDSPLQTMIHVFCERTWKTRSFEVRQILPHDTEAEQNRLPLKSSDEDALVSMKAMERRYAFENELIRAVERGQLHMEEHLLARFSNHLFEKRTPDLLRNAKNYGIIMNTLLRKAAEHGGVHPIHLDRVSSQLAIRIEELPSLQQTHTLMCEIFRSYCLLVREHATHALPKLVQQTVILIDSDLSADLSPALLAERQGVSLGYLSQLFKRATGETISQYVRRQRMALAAHLLRTTHLQIQTVALHCGILDVQYFSKLFRTHWGVSPTQYRQDHRTKSAL